MNIFFLFSPKCPNGYCWKPSYRKPQGLVHPQHWLSIGRDWHTTSWKKQTSKQKKQVFYCYLHSFTSPFLCKPLQTDLILKHSIKQLFSRPPMIWMWSNSVATFLFTFYWHDICAAFKTWGHILLHDPFSCLIFVKPYSSVFHLFYPLWMKKGPYTEPDKLRGRQHGRPCKLRLKLIT